MSGSSPEPEAITKSLGKSWSSASACSYRHIIKESRLDVRILFNGLNRGLGLTVSSRLCDGRGKFNRIAKTLLDWGAEVDLKRLEEYYFSLRVLSPEQYHSLLRLLSVFAEHLAACANRFKMERKPACSGPIVKAKRLVQERFQERVSLKEVAAAVNVSATYFSRLFRQATGMTFVDFVA